MEHEAVSTFTDVRAWSQQPPGLSPVDVPQFVAVTFDDNFVSGLGEPAGGMTWATSFFEPLVNPAGSAFAATFDGTPVRTSFYDNCVYLEDENTRKSWLTSFEDGHEIANHTVHHSNGLAFTEQGWVDEIAPCTMALSNAESGVGVSVDGIKGFRAPFLAYGSAMFGALKAQGLKPVFDKATQSPAMVGNGKFVGYDDPRSVRAKVAFAKKAGLAGVFAWELSQDDGRLLDAMNTMRRP